MKKDIALVLSSGGARGIAHIGVIEELIDRGYNISSISGTSMGALVGGIYASGKFKEFKEWMCKLDKKEVFRLVDFSVRGSGIVKGEKVIEHMKNFIPDKDIEKLNIPFSAVAVDIHKGKEVVFTEGSMFDAIRASISIPAVFRPAKINGVYYVDGGILNPLPLNRVKRKRDDILVAVMVNARDSESLSEIKENIKKEVENLDKREEKSKSGKKSDEDESLKNKISNFLSSSKEEFYSKLDNLIPKSEDDHLGFFNLSNKSISLMIKKLSDMSLDAYKPEISIKVPRSNFGTFDFYKSEELIAHGKSIAKKALDDYENK